MNDNDHQLSLCTVMFTTFLTLKLTGNVDWSWWWVASPLWAPAVLAILVLFLGKFIQSCERLLR
jgi:hypothetical protein